MSATSDSDHAMKTALTRKIGNGVPKVAATAVPTIVRDIKWDRITCPTCRMQELCLGQGLDAQTLHEIDALVTSRVRFHGGESLYRDGDRFTCLYAIRSGSCKTVSLSESGHEQVAGFHMSGEIIGTDGIDTERHRCQAVALEDTEVCALSFARMEALERNNPHFQHNLHCLLAREIGRERTMMALLGTMDAERRLAAFLLDLSHRYHARGYSPCEFVLRMTREEIGSYLGLKLETVSRLFSRFQREALLQVQGRVVKLLERLSLQRLLEDADR